MSPIVFNRKSYASVDEMPPEVLQAYKQFTDLFADENQDGLPDIFEGKISEGGVHTQSVSISSAETSQILVDGKKYSSVDEMPADQDNVPDMLKEIFPDQTVSSAREQARLETETKPMPRLRTQPRPL